MLESKTPAQEPRLSLLDLLRTRFEPSLRDLIPIYEEPTKAIYRVQRSAGFPWAVRLFPLARPLERVRGDAAVLRHVASHGIRAERVVLASDGESCVELNGRGVLVTEWIQGTRPDRSPEGLRRIGEVVGRLHALPPVPAGDPLLRRRAGALPASDLPFGLRCLDGVAGRVPEGYRAEYEALRAALLGTRDCEELPAEAWGLIHNDCHLANALRTPGGEVAFFDWDGSGQGPRVAALGVLLYSCAVQAPGDPLIPSDLRRVDHLLDGYCRHHTLSRAEAGLLPDAMRFRPAVVAARELAASINRGDPPVPKQRAQPWAARYTEADAAAARAQDILLR